MMRAAASQETLADAALAYANLGVPVFPCVPGGKRPLTRNGFHDATSSAPMVHHWWERTPDANIGLRTGARTAIGVVDVDVHGDNSGFAAFERARAAGLADGWGWLVRTPSGGLHAYYPLGDTGEQRSWQAPSAHIDFRGDGGYIIAPPSRITVAGRSTTYDVIAVSNHAAHPIDALKLRHFLEPPRSLPLRSSDLPPIGTRPDKLAAWVASRPEGRRNGGLFWAACRMVENGHDYRDTLAALGDAAVSAGLPEREVETTVQSACRIASRLSSTPGAGRLGPTRTSEAIER